LKERWGFAPHTQGSLEKEPIYQKCVGLFCRLFCGYTGLFRERCRDLLRKMKGPSALEITNPSKKSPASLSKETYISLERALCVRKRACERALHISDIWARLYWRSRVRTRYVCVCLHMRVGLSFEMCVCPYIRNM